jgi:hypothetical protein
VASSWLLRSPSQLPEQVDSHEGHQRPRMA